MNKTYSKGLFSLILAVLSALIIFNYESRPDAAFHIGFRTLSVVIGVPACWFSSIFFSISSVRHENKIGKIFAFLSLLIILIIVSIIVLKVKI